KSSHVITNEIRQLLAFKEVEHPHLIKVHNIILTPGHIVISMERADGSLADLHRAYLEECKMHIPPDHLCDLFWQAAEALDFIAQTKPGGFMSTGLQHCDVKPSNLLFIGDCLKVADFGLCSAQQPNRRSGFMGTPPYAAPELYQGRLCARTDQYALAVSYCELRGGRLPFNVKDPKTSEHQQHPPDLSMLPAEERPIVARALDPTWLDRWPSCKDFIRSLRSVVKTGACSALTMPILPARPTDHP
ncbi:MAG: protein kinase, partial [Acidobacteria bacterium]|nr:protein kinase [Acidobacteriota bacterium]